MQKLRTFFRSVFLSCTSPAYYLDILKAKFEFSLSYLIFFNFLLSFITTALIVFPLYLFDARALLTSFQNNIPRDVTLTLNEGKLSLNQPLPYKIAFPDQGDDVESPQYLVVFESDENISGMSDVVAQNSLAVITETSAYIRKDDEAGKFENYYFGDSKESGSFSSSQAKTFIDTLINHPLIAQKLYIPLIGLFLLVFVALFMMIRALLSAAIYGLAVLVMARLLSKQLMTGQNLSYSKAVQVAIHSSTLLILIQVVLNALLPDHPFHGIIYFVAFLVWTGVLLSQAHSHEGQPVVNKLPPEQPVRSIDRIEDPL